MSNDKKNTYTDLQGREFKSLPKLCTENEASYNRVYFLYKVKGLPLEEAIKDGQRVFKEMQDKEKPSAFPDTFIPKTIYPGREYIAYFEWQRDYMWKVAGDKAASARAQDILDRLERNWLILVDAVECDDKELLCHASEKMIEAARRILSYPTGVYKDIYDVFARKYALGRYREVKEPDIYSEPGPDINRESGLEHLSPKC